MVVWYAFANLPLRTMLRCDILFYTQGVQHGFALRMVSERPEFRLVTSAQGQAEGALTAAAFLRTQNVSFFYCRLSGKEEGLVVPYDGARH